VTRGTLEPLQVGVEGETKKTVQDCVRKEDLIGLQWVKKGTSWETKVGLHFTLSVGKGETEDGVFPWLVEKLK